MCKSLSIEEQRESEEKIKELIEIILETRVDYKMFDLGEFMYRCIDQRNIFLISEKVQELIFKTAMENNIKWTEYDINVISADNRVYINIEPIGNKSMLPLRKIISIIKEKYYD